MLPTHLSTGPCTTPAPAHPPTPPPTAHPHAHLPVYLLQVIADFADGEISQAASLFDTGITLQAYLDKSFYKTASLIAASCRSAAVFSDCEVDGERAWGGGTGRLRGGGVAGCWRGLYGEMPAGCVVNGWVGVNVAAVDSCMWQRQEGVGVSGVAGGWGRWWRGAPCRRNRHSTLASGHAVLAPGRWQVPLACARPPSASSRVLMTD